MKGETPGENRPRLDLGGRASPPHAPSIKCSVAEAGVRAFPSPKYRVFRAGLLLHVLPRLRTDPSGRDCCCCMFSLAQVPSLPGGTAAACSPSPKYRSFRAGLLLHVLRRPGIESSGRDDAVLCPFNHNHPSVESSGRDARPLSVSCARGRRGQVRKLPGGTLPGGKRGRSPGRVLAAATAKSGNFRAGLCRAGRHR